MKMTRPLEGIRVADFSHVMAGPYATHLLHLLGAEIIKIEAPGRGDAMRYYGSDRRYDGMAPAFIGVNAGKKSVVLDLKHPPALAAARRLIESCDVLVENFRPGVMQRLGLDYESVRALQPRIVYCSISGYGQSGPRRDWAAIDNIVQATSGMMTLSGTTDDEPSRVGFPVVDTLTGQTAAFAILAALLRRERQNRGEYIDVAMFDASIAFMTSAVVPYLVTGQQPERTGNVGYSGQPTSALFTAADGRSISLGGRAAGAVRIASESTRLRTLAARSAIHLAGSAAQARAGNARGTRAHLCASARRRVGAPPERSGAAVRNGA
jgi:crotonobetainyl-CoA:carnitine CoA-transferase CaiB-like acyl-CoA transferase